MRSPRVSIRGFIGRALVVLWEAHLGSPQQQQHSTLMDLFLSLRVSIVRAMLSYNDRAERKQRPRPPSPAYIEKVSSPSPHGSVNLHIYVLTKLNDDGRDTSPRHPVVIDFHGGGFSTGIPSMDARWANALLNTSVRPVVIGVDYSLAPECPFPAALQDAAAVLSWCVGPGAQKCHLDPTRIVITGFSAGGTLALTAPMWIAEGHWSPSAHEVDDSKATQNLSVPLRGVVSIYPRVDYRLPWKPAGSAPTRFLNSVWSAAYPGDGPVASPFISPAAAEDRLLDTGLPKNVSLYTVEQDWLLESAEGFRERLIALGKTVNGHIEPGVPHAWDKMPVRKDDTTGWKKRDAWFAAMAADVEQMLS